MNYKSAFEAKEYCRANMKGIWAALCTPFTQSGEVDEASLRRNVNYCIESLKIDGFFFNGLSGEFWSLTPGERLSIQKIVCEESRGRAQTIVHTGHVNIREVIELIHQAEKVGGDYVVMVNPFYGAREDDEVYLYFKTIADQTSMGIGLFNQPKSGKTLSPELIERLSDLPNVCCIKNAVSDKVHMQNVRARVGEKIVVCDPFEPNMLEAMTEYGMQAHMSSPCPFLYQVPGYTPMKDMYDAIQRQDLDQAFKIHRSLEPLREVKKKYFTTGPDGRTTAYLKEWSHLVGIGAGEPRPPVVPLTPAQKMEFHADLFKTGILDRVRR